MRDRTTDEIFTSLYQTPRWKFQFSLRTLVVLLGIMPVVGWLSYLVLPHATAAVWALFAPGKSTDIDLFTDSVISIALAFLAAGCGAFFLMLLSNGGKVVVVALVGGTLATGCVAILLWLFDGAGDTFAATAQAEDYFVVYGIPLSISISIGTVLGVAARDR